MSEVTMTREGRTTILTLNRPERMNAISMGLVQGLLDALEAIESDSRTRVVVVTGAGSKAFCAGADLKERRTMTEEQTRGFLRKLRLALTRLQDLDRPTIAAVNGVALGGGCELALTCDIRVMSETASMGLTETRLAIIPGAGGTQRLPRLVGLGRAKEMIFTGRRVGAEEALGIGLCERVAPPESLIPECLELAEAMCQAGPLALTQAKFAIDKGFDVDLNTGLDIEGKAYEVLLPTEDRREALRAFQEKRAPNFKGR